MMACTTIKVLPKNRVVNDRFEAYCQVVHVNRLISVRPAIDTRLEHRELVKQQKRQRRRLKAAREYEQKTLIRLQNEQLMRKILTAHSSMAQARNRSTVSVRADSRLANITRNNLRFQRLESTRMARVKLQQENESMMRRILAVRPTIDVRIMEHECHERSKLLRKRAKYSRNRVLDFSDLTLQSALKGKSALFPTPPQHKAKPRRFRRRRVRLRSAKSGHSKGANLITSEQAARTVASILEKLVGEIAESVEACTLAGKETPSTCSLSSVDSSSKTSLVTSQGVDTLERLATKYSSLSVQDATSALSTLSAPCSTDDSRCG